MQGSRSGCRWTSSVVIKARNLKAKAKAKYLSFKAKAKAKDLSFKAKAKAKDLSLKAKAKAKDLNLKAKAKDLNFKSKNGWTSNPKSLPDHVEPSIDSKDCIKMIQ